MRFLLGLILGAGAVLLLAGTITGERDWPDRAAAAMAGVVAGVVAGVEGWVEQTRPGSAPAGALPIAERPEPVPPDELEPARQPIPRPTDPRPVDLADPEVAQPIVQDQRLAEAGAATPSPPGRNDPQDHAQNIWVPFRSEMSANGFASRLTESLDHPFRVERRGPGRYQVVFPYADEPQRQTLLAEAAAATGLPL